jgi:hypothetical protein
MAIPHPLNASAVLVEVVPSLSQSMCDFLVTLEPLSDSAKSALGINGREYRRLI